MTRAHLFVSRRPLRLGTCTPLGPQTPEQSLFPREQVVLSDCRASVLTRGHIACAAVILEAALQSPAHRRGGNVFTRACRLRGRSDRPAIAYLGNRARVFAGQHEVGLDAIAAHNNMTGVARRVSRAVVDRIGRGRGVPAPRLAVRCAARAGDMNLRGPRSRAVPRRAPRRQCSKLSRNISIAPHLVLRRCTLSRQWSALRECDAQLRAMPGVQLRILIVDSARNTHRRRSETSARWPPARRGGSCRCRQDR